MITDIFFDDLLQVIYLSAKQLNNYTIQMAVRPVQVCGRLQGGPEAPRQDCTRGFCPVLRLREVHLLYATSVCHE